MDMLSKVAVVTGGGSGIGRGIALALAEVGVDVVVADIDLAAADAVAREVQGLGRRGVAFKCDVTREASVEALADFAWSEMGHVELVFNNAGVAMMGLATEVPSTDLLWTYNVNVFGVWFGSVVFLRRFIDKGIHGWICNTGSENSLGVTSLGTTVYAGAKHAVLGMTDTLRSEYRGKVGFSVLCPGMVKTNIWDAARNRPEEYGGVAKGSEMGKQALGYGLTPELVGRHVVRAVANEEFYILTHPHVREIVQERWNEIDAALLRQWPEGATAEHFSALDVQKKLLDDAAGEGRAFS